MREFITRAIESEAKDAGEEEVYDFLVDGHKCVTYPPTAGQLGIFMALIADINAWQTQSAGIINFFLGLCDDSTKAYFAQRLLDRSDPFEIENVRDILTELMGEWTGNPTESPSGSGGSLSDGGRSSSTSSPEAALT